VVKLFLLLAIAASGALFGCAERQSAPPARPVSSPSTSPICEALLGEFVGLPAELDDTGKQAGPAAGRWWIRHCDFAGSADELNVRLAGPGWYWVDHSDPPFHLRQHVYFNVDASLYGKIDRRIGWKDGSISLWFRPTRSNVSVEAIGKVHPTSRNVVLSVLSFLASPLPGISADARARERVESEATERFEQALGHGYTLVYDLDTGRSDFALGILDAGTRPEHPFGGDRPWLANERLTAAPGGVHVLGPFDSEKARWVDVDVTRGQGVGWRTVCAGPLERAFSSVEHGDQTEVPSSGMLESGEFSGVGLHHAKLTPADCRFYVVISGIGNDVSDAAVRVRS
jgi:hypothetical protein